MIVDGTADEDDAILEQARVDVEGTLSARALFDDHGDQVTHLIHSSFSRQDQRLRFCCGGCRFGLRVFDQKLHGFISDDSVHQ